MLLGKLFLLTAAGRPAVPTVASVASIAVHGALAFAMAYGPLRASAPVRPLELEVDVEPSVETVPDPREEHRDVVTDEPREHPRVEPHSHPYPVPPDHDAVPHSPRVDHRAPGVEGALAAAPRVVTAADSPRPTFSIVLGQDDSTSGGWSGASGTGNGSGNGGQNGGAPVRAPGPQPEEVYSDATVSEHARLLSSLRPEYPAAARAQGLEATLSFEIVVDREGKVDDVRVLRGAGYGFEDSAVRALRSARFRPAVRDDRRVWVRMPWTIDFRLE